MEFRANPWRRYDEAGLTLLFAGLLGATIVALAQGERVLLWGAFTLLWLAMFGGALYILATSVHTFVFESNGLRIRSLTFQRLLAYDSIELVQIEEKGSSGAATIRAGGKTYGTLLKNFDDRTALCEALRSRLGSNQRTATQLALETRRVFRAKGATLVFGFISTLVTVLLSLAQDMQTRLIGWGLCAILWGFFFLLARTLARVSPDGLFVRRLGKGRFVPWNGMLEATLSMRRATRTSDEVLTLRDKEGSLLLNGIFDNYPLLRDVVLSQIPADRVHDKR